MPPTQEEINEGARQIIQTIQSGKPFFIGRNGSTELESLYHYTQRGGLMMYLDLRLIRRLERVSGIWPAEQETFCKWVKDYVESLSSIQGLSAGWYPPMVEYEQILLKNTCPTAFQMPLRSLEPYYVEPELRWTKHLSGTRIAIVSSFTETIQAQLAKGMKAIWPSNPMFSEDVEWIPIRTYYPPEISGGGETAWPAHIGEWKEAVDYIVEEVVKSGATIAFIGCGALAMSIGARLYKRGVSAILMGGAIQVLFGIKGSRWETHSIISTFWNDEWVYPMERPPGAHKIERGCYW